MSVIIETSLGDFTIDLFTEERPKCCKNFLKLCKVKYYNFCLFHSVQRNFIAQTGDPDGNGRGGESIYGTLYGEQARYFDWEFVPKIKHVKRGLVSMVNNGNNMHGSQFFLTLGDSLDYLDGVHTVIGEVTEGLEVIQKLNEAYCDEKFKPFRDIRIHHTIILEDPFEDPPGLDMPDRSPSPPPAVIERARLAADAEIDDLEGMTEEEIREIMEEREEKANAQLLEMIGDLPSTDITAPENILFVCKLNSVTTDEDLEIIFSRFGPIKSCEVIRDQKTGESLQYAFIEFEKKKDCESAYFKMDNVLIDDRRIHVDFSQSVSKLKWKGKGKGVETVKEDPKKPKYIIKNKSQRQDDNYELVFEENGDNKTSKKKRKDKSHDLDDEYRNKKKHRSRSRSPDRRKYRSPERNRRDERIRSNDRRGRYSPPRYRGDRYSSPTRNRDNRQRSPPRPRGDNYFSPPRYWDDRNSPPRQREKQMDRHRSPAPRDRGKEERSYSRFSEKEGYKKTDKKKYESSDKELLDRQKDKKKKRHENSSDDESMERQKSKKKKRHSVSSGDESLERQKSKEKKRLSVSSDEDERNKSKKKKTKKNDSSDDHEHIHKKRKKKKDLFSDDGDDKDSKNRKKKKKKKKYDSSSEEEPVKHSKKKQHRTNSKSDSESPITDKKYSSDKYPSKSVKDYRESDERRDNHRKRERDEYKGKRR
ncbi:peptidyl-prolyl cis-trans isomerase-like 4 [Mytilus californianus]|uniref:peptidyl-prolyl cis-trans isomerase-like 4 n=1 Tax=Mytilus californianus TaxID=6549 RepID=UPI002246CAEC|nr:peptidyl-prolyl cis-trans isomerase-like 4 [Mytilus californianus]